jgi:hypothetical protein
MTRRVSSYASTLASAEKCDIRTVTRPQCSLKGRVDSDRRQSPVRIKAIGLPHFADMMMTTGEDQPSITEGLLAWTARRRLVTASSRLLPCGCSPSMLNPR